MKIVKWVLVLIGIAVTIWLIIDTGPQKIWQEICQLGPFYLMLFMLPFLGVYLLDTVGWKYAFNRQIKIPFMTLFGARVAGEAINHATPTAYLGGEPVKAYILYKNRNTPLAHGFASVTIGKFMMVASEVIFILIGIILAISVLGKESPLFWGIGLSLTFLTVFLTIFLFMQIRGFGTLFGSKLKRFMPLQKQDKYENSLQEFDSVLADYYSNEKLRLFLSFIFYFLSWCIGIFEVYIFLAVMGYHVDFVTLFAIEALASAVKGAGFFIPGSVGVQEAGQMGIFVLFGYDQSLGMTFAILRRTREIIWIVLGLLLLGWNGENRLWEDKNEQE